MKLVVIHITGLPTERREELYGRTLLEAARTDALDEIAHYGSCGTVQLLPDGVVAGAGTELLYLLGALQQDDEAPSGGALDALGIGAPLYARDVALRVNLSSLGEDGRVLDVSGGGIPEADALALMQEVDERLGTRHRRFYPGRYCSHVMVWTDGPVGLYCVPAPLAVGRPVEDVLPRGDGDGPLTEFIWDTVDLLNDHRLNHIRREEGLLPVNVAWPWAPGRAPELPHFALRFRVEGRVLAERFELLGAARAFGLRVGSPGSTPEQMAAALLGAARECSLAYIHLDVQAFFEHPTEPEAHVSAFSQTDTGLLAPVLKEIRGAGEPTRLLVVGSWAEVGWWERPAALWGTFPALRAIRATADAFAEAALAEQGERETDSHRLVQAAVSDTA